MARRKIFKVLAWVAGVLVVLVVAAGVSVYLFVTSEYFRAQIENHASAIAGRKTTIGKLDIDWGWTAHVRVTDIALSNTDWGKAPHMFEAKLVEFDIRLWPLLGGHIVLPTLTLESPTVALELNAKGETNWDFSQSPVAATALGAIKPTERSEAPIIGRFKITGGHLSYQDPARRLELKGTVQTASGQAPDNDRSELVLKGILEAKPLAVKFTGGSVLSLRDDNTPFPLDLNVQFGNTRLALKGTVQDPFTFAGANVQMSLAGPDLSEIFPILGIPAPPTAPYKLAGKLIRTDKVWRLEDMAGRVGDSDLRGVVSVEQRSKKSFLQANLTSDVLSFADLAPLVGASPGAKGTVSAEQAQTAQQLQAAGDLFPNIPLHVEKLRVMDMDVTLVAKKVVAPDYLPVQALKFQVKVQDGKAVVQPLEMSVAGGTVSGQMQLDAQSDTPVAGASLQFDNLDLALFFRNSRYFDTTRGKMQGVIKLTGKGHSLAQVMGTADGDAALAMSGGTVSELIISLAGLDIGNALVIYITSDHRIPINCALGQLHLTGGVATFAKTLVDTQKSVLHVDGTTSLAGQTVDIKITADAKDFSLLDLHAPVVLKGKIRSPDVSIGALVPIPLIELGGAKDIDCGRLIKETLAAH